MGADVTSKMKNDLTTMHCASQTYHGLLSMLILHKKHNIPVNLHDAKNATPLHFAAMHREPKNVEYLVAKGAELDVQDCQGHTPIHICMIRMIQDPDSFDEYKRIIKTLLFAGAKRDIKTKSGDTAMDLLVKHEHVFEEREFSSLRFILSDYKECMCFQRHRPIRKVERSPFIIILSLVLNAIVLCAFYLSCL